MVLFFYSDLNKVKIHVHHQITDIKFMCYYLSAHDELFNPESLQLKVAGAGHKRQDSGYVFSLHLHGVT